MNDINRVLITGTLTRDIELRFTPTGIAVGNLRLAINRKYQNKQQEIKEEVEFITAVVWERLAENCAKYLKKGSHVFVEGRLLTRKFIDKDNRDREVTEIKAETVEFLDRPEKKPETVAEVKKGVKNAS